MVNEFYMYIEPLYIVLGFFLSLALILMYRVKRKPTVPPMPVMLRPFITFLKVESVSDIPDAHRLLGMIVACDNKLYVYTGEEFELIKNDEVCPTCGQVV